MRAVRAATGAPALHRSERAQGAAGATGARGGVLRLVMLATLHAHVAGQAWGGGNIMAPCEWHVHAGHPINFWDSAGPLPGELELPCGTSLPYYPEYNTTRQMCDEVFCPECGPYAQYCDLMCGFTLAPSENQYDAQAGAGTCDRMITGGEYTCAADFCPTCGGAAHYCDAACGSCTSVHDAHPGSMCVEEFFLDWGRWDDAGCSPGDGQSHCSDVCQNKLSSILYTVEVMCSGHDLEQLPIHCATPGCTTLHVGHWLHGVVQSDELCNPHACSTLFLEVNEYCLYGTGDDQNPQPFGCNTTLCELARQNMATHVNNCTGDRDAAIYNNMNFAANQLAVEHECLLCHPGDIQTACAQQGVGGSSCAADCAAEVFDFVDNRLEECRQVMLDIGYDYATLQTIEHLYSICAGNSCVVIPPVDAYLDLDGSNACQHTGVLHPGETCEVLCDRGFDREGDGIASCSAGGQLSLNMICHERDCYQPVVFPPHVLKGSCDVFPLVGGTNPLEVELHLALGSSCQPTCHRGYVSNGEHIECNPHHSYGGFLEHNFECHLPCDTSRVTQPINGQFGTECHGQPGDNITHGHSCDLACDAGFVITDQPVCEGRGDNTYLTSNTGSCSMISPAAFVTGHLTFGESPGQTFDQNDAGFLGAFDRLINDEYNEFVGPTTLDRITVTAINRVGVNAVRVSYRVEVDCAASCAGQAECLGPQCVPASSGTIDVRASGSCVGNRCPLRVGPFYTIDPSMVTPLPTVQAQVTLDTTMATVNAARTVFEQNFRSDVATALDIYASAVAILSIQAGSVVVTFTVDGLELQAIDATLVGVTLAGALVLQDVPAPTPGPGPPPSIVCTNDDPHCHSWSVLVADGVAECDRNFDYMHLICALWCEDDCASLRDDHVATTASTQAQDPLPSAAVPTPAVAAPPPAEKPGGGGVIVSIFILLGGGGGAAAFMKSQQGKQLPERTGMEIEMASDDSPKAMDKEGHIKDDDHEDNPLADYDVETQEQGEGQGSPVNPMHEDEVGMEFADT